MRNILSFLVLILVSNDAFAMTRDEQGREELMEQVIQIRERAAAAQEVSAGFMSRYEDYNTTQDKLKSANNQETKQLIQDYKLLCGQ